MVDNHNRRKVLKAIAGSASLSSINIVSGNSSPASAESDTKLLTGTSSSPVTKSDVRSARNELVSQASPTNSDWDVIPFGAPKWDIDNTHVAFYAAKIDENGKPIVHIGYSGEDKNGGVKKKHDRAYQVKQSMESASSSAEYRKQTFSNTERENVSSNVVTGNDWEKFGKVYAEREQSEGNIYLSSTPKVYLGPIEGNKDLWAATGNYIIQPEMHEDPGLTAHLTESVKVEQDFGDGIPEVDWVGSTAPSGDKTGRVTGKSVSLSGDSSGSASATISWNYSQPEIKRYDRTNTSGDENEAAWKYETTEDSAGDRLQFFLGSKHWLENAPGCPEEDSNLQWNLGETRLKATFDSAYRLPDTYEIGSSWYGWVCL